MKAKHEKVVAAWKAAGRDGAPRLVGARYFALGDDVAEASAASTRAYYAFGGEDFVSMMLASTLRDADAIRTAADEIRATGADEVFFWPTTGDLAQVDRLADLLL